MIPQFIAYKLRNVGKFSNIPQFINYKLRNVGKLNKIPKIIVFENPKIAMRLWRLFSSFSYTIIGQLSQYTEGTPN
jgi:hypothetical protein